MNTDSHGWKHGAIANWVDFDVQQGCYRHTHLLTDAEPVDLERLSPLCLTDWIEEYHRHDRLHSAHRLNREICLGLGESFHEKKGQPEEEK